MSASKTKNITVDTKDALESAITQYAAQGYSVINKSEKRVTMQKPKKFNIAIGIIGFLLCFIGLIIYAIMYSMQPDCEIIEISISQ